MAYDYPANPTQDQIYHTPDGVTYQWNGYAWVRGSGIGVPGGSAAYVLRAGDAMQGFLSGHADPVDPLHYATKQYVDAAVAAAAAASDDEHSE